MRAARAVGSLEADSPARLAAGRSRLAAHSCRRAETDRRDSVAADRKARRRSSLGRRAQRRAWIEAHLELVALVLASRRAHARIAGSGRALTGQSQSRTRGSALFLVSRMMEDTNQPRSRDNPKEALCALSSGARR